MLSPAELRLWDIKIIKELKGMAGMLKNPHATENIYLIEDGLLDAEVTKESYRYIKEQEGVSEFVKDRFLRNGGYDIEKLRELSEGTLGKTLANQLDYYGFDPSYYHPLEVKDDLTYAFMRVRETHDVWHFTNRSLANSNW